MIGDISKIYEIGKDLGLSRKEISSSLKTNRNYFKYFFIKYLLISFLIILIWTISLTILHAYFPAPQTYGETGARYSTIKIQDFRKKKRKLSYLLTQIVNFTER